MHVVESAKELCRERSWFPKARRCAVSFRLALSSPQFTLLAFAIQSLTPFVTVPGLTVDSLSIDPPPAVFVPTSVHGNSKLVCSQITYPSRNQEQ
ncbi:uncharacterized protein BT62DRAFT_635371 [Guyanagaster necrorhizus]|uniref:Uncharacterized protein n=1 Tax=Guyanagaster necrorhizus TaxID=856835 RepID=A0A9P7VGL3_9AGAR|nr:uncharacterized protein BT62DRAFT_635371 [Guyanagaster necrorhizus MCA 3950]KAG7440183.1 hypothetical protein BT62DRAFT_635371 [Guyanagaster necrorhizus MCA 3950]